MRVEMNLATPLGSTAIATGKVPDDIDAFFQELRETVLAWHAPLGAGRHAFTAFLRARRRDTAHETLLHAVCARWNADPALAALAPTHVELSIGSDAEQWYGCTTSATPMDRRSGTVAMHVFEHARLLADIDRAQRDAESIERERRRANPVVAPVTLPAGIAGEVARYLRLEYGERWWQPGSLRARDLVFAGEFVIDGVSTQFWRYPGSDGPRWATVERFEHHYAIGMRDEGPPAS
jgi:hypothetical protein